MKQIFKYALILIAIIATCLPEAYSKKTSKKHEETITVTEDYAYQLQSPAASMVIEYTNRYTIRDEFIFEDGNTIPTMRILRELMGNAFQDDTLSYNAQGKIIRVGKLRNHDVNKRVELFDDRNSYLVKYILPYWSRTKQNGELYVTDFDSHGNWTKAFTKDDKKNPVLTRTITYTLTPEQEAMLQQNKATTTQDIEADKALWRGIKTIGFGILLLCAVMCILGAFMKNVWGGQPRWIIWLICGIPLATFLYLYADRLLEHTPHAIKVIFRIGSLVIYMILMRIAIMKMSNDRRIPNGLISAVNVIWSLWAFFLLCPPAVSSIMPNFVGRILSWVLGAVLWMINYGYTASRCPRCHNPHGLEFDHRSLEGYRTESNTSNSTTRKNPEVVGLSQSGNDFNAKVRTDTTHRSTTTTNTYEIVRDHYVCYECGYVESTGKFKGALIARNVSSTTNRSKEVHDVHGRFE